MSKYFRYKDNEYDIKLKRLGPSAKRNGYFHIPVAGCNDFSRRWFERGKDGFAPSDNWHSLVPFEQPTNCFNAVTKIPCNLPGDKVR